MPKKRIIVATFVELICLTIGQLLLSLLAPEVGRKLVSACR
jgi:hypothetical protein